jgi:hypothetical protein
MIDKIFIPTLHRVDNQIAYNALPPSLQEKVVFVVQAHEREKYHYPNEYLVLPDYITPDHPRAIAHTRKHIYDAGRNIRYVMMDDDVTFKRRNAKYWTGESTMDMSKRSASHDDILEMFDTFDGWLDEDSVAFCGAGLEDNPPSNKPFNSNTALFSAYWIDGPSFSHTLDDLPLTEVKINEDVVFVLSLFTRGFGNRVSVEFCLYNASVHKRDMESTVWDEQTRESVLQDHRRIEEMFPGLFEVLYDSDGDRVSGGFRDFGKSRIHWNKAYKQSPRNEVDLTQI